MSKHREIELESAIEADLINRGGYQPVNPKEYMADLGLFPFEVIEFVKSSQSVKWTSLEASLGEKAEDTLITTLRKELNSKGALKVLRQGFKCFGKTFKLAYFTPNTKLNDGAWADYEFNRLGVSRQVHFDPENKALSVDMVLALNGLPVVTIELKNPMSNGETVEDAKIQYNGRNPNAPLFRFKERALVHFAVDPDNVLMTTKLAKGDTRFLPFNKGRDNGAGNPILKGDYDTAYLWKEVLAKDSLMDILARFLHLEIEEKKIVTKGGVKTKRKETMIFPRYHQLDVVRKLITSSQDKGSGHNYLVQHSAGSGKSNSIAWLAHRLSSLHNADDEKVFDTVVVITDRRVLDQQLQDTIYQFEHKQGVVQKIDENTQQLAKALSGGTPIVISTIQKFPFITQAMDTLAKKGEGIDLSTSGRKFAVIVDEAHSSQSGETAKELRKVLNRDGIEAAIAEEFLGTEDEDMSEDAKENLAREMKARPKQPNISFFAFTATPKYKTLKLFDEPGPSGEAPFHLYSMKQAIEENFIMDVLKYYTTYKSYFGVIKKIEDDPNVPKREAAKSLAKYISLHPVNISQKVEVIIEHFRSHTKHKIGGRAKAMVVTGSRLHAVRYKLAFDKYIKDKGYEGIRSLVAFSGKVVDPDVPNSSFTETSMNDGIREPEVPEKFASEEYQVLLVADKYQTGFDQPLLHSMYVDKRLSGIQAVQTLSRLNRKTTGKEDTFVMDFVNEREEIFHSFKQYHTVALPGEEPDPHKLYELQHKLEDAQVFETSEVDQFSEIWFKDRYEPTSKDHQKIDSILKLAVERYKKHSEDEKEEFKSLLTSFRSLYAFLSQIIPYQDSTLEKLYTYGRFLLARLPKHSESEQYDVDDEVALKFYRLQKISEGSIELNEGEASFLKGPSDVGTRKAADDEVPLSILIGKLNERFGTDFALADQLFFDQVEETAVNDSALISAAHANSIDNFRLVFEKAFPGLVIGRMDSNEEIVDRLMQDQRFKEAASAHILQEVYDRIRSEKRPSLGEVLDGKIEENDFIEFKSTFQWDIREGKKNRELQKSVLKTIVAFLNSSGGMLAVGVTDDHKIFGLDADYALLSKPDKREWFHQLVTDAINNRIGAEYTNLISAKFEEHEAKDVLVIDIKRKGPKEAYLTTNRDTEFFVRTGKKTIQLKGREMSDYIRANW